MKVRVWIEREIEVEVTAEDAVDAILNLDEPEHLPMALRGISHCAGFLKHIPDALIAEMNDKQREIILDKTPNVELRGCALLRSPA